MTKYLWLKWSSYKIKSTAQSGVALLINKGKWWMSLKDWAVATDTGFIVFDLGKEGQNCKKKKVFNGNEIFSTRFLSFGHIIYKLHFSFPFFGTIV